MTQEELLNIQKLSAMERLRCIYDILKPLFEGQEQQQEQKQQQDKWKDTPIDIDEICSLKNGIRIANILYDGCWGNNFSVDKHCGEPKHSVHTIRDLLQVEEHEFLKHRQAGKKSWESLNEYKQQIINKYKI